jgi:anti-sigma factor RsiW
MMNCQQAKPLIEAYADGELEAGAILELEEHLKGCAACARAFQKTQDLKKALKQDAFYFSAPEELCHRIKAALPSLAPTAPQRAGWNWAVNWNWLTTALSGVAAVCLALLLVVTLAQPKPQDLLAQEIVSSHIRSLMANHVMDVASTDQHTVKPWFNGKLDFSPPVKDLATQEFPLTGGRLDYLDGRSVAALVFQRHSATADAQPVIGAARQGYHLIHWTAGGMVFWAVSDLNERELMEFAQDYQTAIPLK